jgi:hypothetical protein
VEDGSLLEGRDRMNDYLDMESVFGALGSSSPPCRHPSACRCGCSSRRAARTTGRRHESDPPTSVVADGADPRHPTANEAASVAGSVKLQTVPSPHMDWRDALAYSGAAAEEIDDGKEGEKNRL